MGYQLDLDEALRDWGLSDYLHLVNGWQTHGSSVFNPGGAVNHHTAGSRRYKMPSLRILVEGRAGLPGPLCNVGQSRSTEFDASAKHDEIYLIAAGRANHAGHGGWRGLVGNSSVFGLEIEHTGNLSTEPWPERRLHTAYLIHRAFMEVGGFTATMVAQHKEWAPTRKIDFIGANGSTFRSELARIQRSPTFPPEEEDDMTAYLARFREKAGSSAAHTYRVQGSSCTWFSTNDEIQTALFLGAKWIGGTAEKSFLDPNVWKSLAVFNGPLRNVPDDSERAANALK